MIFLQMLRNCRFITVLLGPNRWNFYGNGCCMFQLYFSYSYFYTFTIQNPLQYMIYSFI